MPGISGGNVLRSNGGNRSNLAPPMVIDLTEDNDKDKRRTEKRHEKVKKSNTHFIDLSNTSDEEPSAPTKASGPVKPQVKILGKYPANATAKPSAKSSRYQNGGIYSLLSESGSDDEPPIKVSDSASKEIRGDLMNNTMPTQSPSKSTSNGSEMPSSVPLRRGTARKSGSVSHRKFNSGSVGSVGSNHTQDKKTSASSSVSSTSGASKSHVAVSRSGTTSNSSHVIGQQSSSKATASSTYSLTQPNLSTAKFNANRTISVASPLAPISTNDKCSRKNSGSTIPSAHHGSENAATPRLQHPSPTEIEESPISLKKAQSICHRTRFNSDGSGSENDGETLAELDSQKGKDISRKSRMEREAGYSKLAEKEDNNLNLSTSREVSPSTRKVVEREADLDKFATDNGRNSLKNYKDDNAENDNGNGDIQRRTLKPARKPPYQKKGNHGGARRGAAWEQYKLQKAREMKEKDTGDEGADDDDDDDDDDIQPFPRRKRKRDQDPNHHLISGHSSVRSASPALPSKSSEEERTRRWEVRIDPMPVQNLSTTDKSSKVERQELSMDEVKRSLVSLEETMMEDRGLSVRTLLEKRQMRAQIAMNIDSLDDESPFASLEAPDGDTEGAVKWNIRTTRKSKTQIYVLPIAVGDGGVERTPSYTHHTNVIRNHLTGDDETLRYIPLVDEETSLTRVEKEINAAYAERNDDPPRDKELISQIDRQIDGCLDGMGYDNCDRTALVRYLLGHQSEELPYSTREKNLVLKTLGGPLSGELHEIMEQVAKEIARAFDIKLKNVVLSKSRFKELVESSKAQLFERSEDLPSPPERLETMSQFHCLICHGAACTTHGEYNLQKISKDIPNDGPLEPDSPKGPSKSDWEYVWERFIMHCPDAFRKHNARDHSKKNDNWHPEHWNTDKDTAQTCGGECYYGRTKWMNYTWTQEEENELKRMLSIAKPNRPCSLVDIIDKPCWQIYSKILDLEDRGPVTRSQDLPKQQKCEPAEWYDPKAVPRNRGLRPGWHEDTIAHMHDLRVQSVACVHDGPCRAETNCYCVLSNLLCEQFCGCPDDCGRRFAGCSCHPEGLACSSDTCICIQMNRECGDQCDSCGAIPRIRAQNRYKKTLFQEGCQNIALQRGVNKKLMLGKSQLQGVGFGLFTAEFVRKGEFLIEYAGEVISVNEAERRRLMHNDGDASFLFDLNKEWVVDAARLGNKARFINHAETEADGQNCIARILLVNGEHRISFRASRDIKIGEELFFNYGKKFAEVQGLDKKLGDSKRKMPKTDKGVVTGEEALAELDGFGGKRGARRKKLRDLVEALESGGTAKRKRGWQKGRGRPKGKASKKAKVGDHVAGPARAYVDQEAENTHGDDMMMDVDPTLDLDMIQDSDEEDETFIGKVSSDIEMGDAEDEEDDVDEDGMRRTRRTRKMPARYSR